MTARRPPTWPVIPLALPAAVSIWAGWVGLGQLTGFGVVRLLPGIWDELQLNTAVTLPIGMEAYAAYALYVWLHPGAPRRGRDFARISSIGALTLGALGQVAYHLLAAAGVTAAPWPITAAVACLPVAVLGMGATLAHLLRDAPDDEPVRTTGDNLNVAAPPAPGAPPVGPPVAPVAPFARVGDHPDHPSPAPRPVVDQAPPQPPTRAGNGAPPAGPAPTPRPPDDPMAGRVAALVAQSPTGRPPGRRTVARELQVSEYRAGRLLAQVSNHHGSARKEGTR